MIKSPRGVKQKTAYEISECDWSSDVCSSDLLEMFQDQVFAFTPKGDLIALPRGATPVDFAYAVHSQIGDTCVGAKINGRLLPLRSEERRVGKECRL